MIFTMMHYNKLHYQYKKNKNPACLRIMHIMNRDMISELNFKTLLQLSLVYK